MAGKSSRTINFTKAAIEGLSVPAKRTYFYDEKVPGLTICVTATGHRAFYLVRRIGGRVEKLKLGDFPALTIERARNEAQKANGKIAEGVNPSDARRLEVRAWTLRDAWNEFIIAPTRTKAKRPRSEVTRHGYTYLFDNHLSHWGTRRLTDIKRADVERLHSEIGATRGTYLANRVLSLLKAIYELAIDREACAMNPARKLTPFEETDRERRLQPDEVERFFKAVDADPSEKIRDFVLLALFTGQRRANLLAMRWDEINFTRGVWTIPKTKNGRPHDAPLSQSALDILTRRFIARGESPYVFPGRHAGHLQSPDRQWRDILERAGINGLRIHDLRRSIASWTVNHGVASDIVAKLLAHTDPKATRVYARLDLDPVRAGLEVGTAAILAAAGKRGSDE